MGDFMKGLAFYGIRDLRYEEVPMPKIGKSDDVIIKVKACGICGSDYARYKKLGPYKPGTVWGHEFAGEVTEVGPAVTNFKAGDRICACPSIICGECDYCRSGDFAMCEKLYAIGSLANGGFADYTKMPARNLVKLPDSVSYEAGALIEPSAVAMHAIFKADLHPGDEVAVVGCGSIGEMLIIWAKQLGAKIYAFDIDDGKLQEAKELGADVTINTQSQDPAEALARYTKGVDVAFESAGNPTTSTQVLTLPHKKGKVVYVGIPYADIHMPRYNFEKIIRSELTVRGAFGVTSAPFPGREWSMPLEILSGGHLDITGIISHREKLSRGPELLDDILVNPQKYRKVMLFPEWDYAG